MPQSKRRKPFSNKQKKEQMRKKREKERMKTTDVDTSAEVRFAVPDLVSSDDNEDKTETEREKNAMPASLAAVVKLHQQPTQPHTGKAPHDPNRYRLHFARESSVDIEKRKTESRRPHEQLDESGLEVCYDDIYRPGSALDMPHRPSWSLSMSKGDLERSENRYFHAYLKKIFADHDPADLSYFEQNLETWRQLWRVLEMSNIVMVIADIRHPILHFPPTLYDHVVNDQKKQLVLVLNKIDLVPSSVVLAWMDYFADRFPDLHIIPYTTRPTPSFQPTGLLSRRLRRRGQTTCVAGARQLFSAVAELHKNEDVLAEWRERISQAGVCGDLVDSGVSMEPARSTASPDDTDGSDSLLTIGLVGHPNVGKSSLLNSLVGKKVVSCSRTPGHTKHFQTIHLTRRLRLCDSPGLVFPSLVQKQLQILAGLFPISQVREPYTVVAYLAMRIPLVKLLALQDQSLGQRDRARPGSVTGGNMSRDQLAASEQSAKSTPGWSSWRICEAWAEKRGYLTAKAARPDVYRAANQILRLAIDGRLCMYMRPLGYHRNKGRWESDTRVERIKLLQRQGIDEQSTVDHAASLLADLLLSSSDEESSEEESQRRTTTMSANPFAALAAESSDSDHTN